MVSQNLIEFEKRWTEKCSKIEKSELNEKQAWHISDGFLEEIKTFYKRRDNGDKKDILLLLKEIFNDLDFALQVAISNYRKGHKPSWVEKIFGIKNFNIEFSAIKKVMNN